MDLRDDTADSEWGLLLERCGADLGTSAPAWLSARDDVVRRLRRKQSVNLVVDGKVAWRELIVHLARDHFPDLTTVDLQDGKTVSRRGLVSEILRPLGYTGTVPPAPEDLSELARAIERHRVSRVAVTHFDLVVHRADYEVNLFSALRHLVMERRKLVLLIQSRQPFASLLPRGHPLSDIEVRTVELKGRT